MFQSLRNRRSHRNRRGWFPDDYSEEILSTLATSTRDQIFGFTNAWRNHHHIRLVPRIYAYKHDDLIIRNNNKLSLCSSFISLSLSFSCCVLKTCTGDTRTYVCESLGEIRALASQHPPKHTLIIKARLMVCPRKHNERNVSLSFFLFLSLSLLLRG